MFFRVFPEALDPCFVCFTLSRSSPCNAYHRPHHSLFLVGSVHHLPVVVAVLAGGGSRASWFMGDGEARSSGGGRRRLWAVDGGG